MLARSDVDRAAHGAIARCAQCCRLHAREAKCAGLIASLPMVAESAQENFIFYFETHAASELHHQRERQRSGRFSWLCSRAFWVHLVCRTIPCRSSTHLGRALRLYLLSLFVEILTLSIVIYLVEVPSPIRLILFMLTLVLECFLILSALRESEKYKGAHEVRQFQWDIRAKLCVMASGAWLPAAWWFFELVIELRGRRKYAYHWGPRHPVDLQRCLVALAMLLLHAGIAAAVVRMAWRGGNRLLHSLLRPVVLRDRRFAEVPEPARTHETKCSICLAELEVEDTVLPLPCRHVFHSQCLRLWLRRSELCPLRCSGALLHLPAGQRNRGREADEEGGEGEGEVAGRSPSAGAATEETAARREEAPPSDMELESFDEPLPSTLGRISV
uniref:RING-type domain-containing protein n=1 Tax=Pyrodinium bahamense TaxID=73915 RepID=A0A7S0A4C7_9DINO